MSESEANGSPPEEMSRWMRRLQGMLPRWSREVEQEIATERSEVAENLNNALIAVIRVHKPSVETLLYVLERIKLQVLTPRARDFEAPGKNVNITSKPMPVVGGPKRDDKSSQRKVG